MKQQEPYGKCWTCWKCWCVFSMLGMMSRLHMSYCITSFFREVTFRYTSELRTAGAGSRLVSWMLAEPCSWTPNSSDHVNQFGIHFSPLLFHQKSLKSRHPGILSENDWDVQSPPKRIVPCFFRTFGASPRRVPDSWKSLGRQIQPEIWKSCLGRWLDPKG